ncbi:GntT/GntP/DsdX family permease [Lutispora sp.]|uniref:GntT/GntP/DsdX family permease n=1 Tax=Lutispora sp. TaxID=2828727 RepID=UPI002B2031B4|nr:SLC13 family permease [Lutispora sp.]MEA4963312.1 Na+/H+ antiporter NhaC family protein [Lutispora sp.]
MIFGLPPILGFLPLLLYIILMFKGKDMNVSVLACVILGAILTGESITGFGAVLQQSLSSFLSLIGFIIVLGAGLGEVLTETRVAHNIVYLVIRKAKLKSKKQAILIAMITSTALVSMLGTLAGSNAIIAPIIIPIVASLGITPSTLGVILHGAGATGLYIGPFVPPVVTIMGLTGLSYGKYLMTAGIPLAIIVWGSTYFVASRTQKLTEGKSAYSEDDSVAEDFEATPQIKRATYAFIITMAIMLGYGIMSKAGASYAIVVMLATALVTGFAAGMSFDESLKTLVKGSSKMYWMFFMFVLFDPFLNYVAKSGAFNAIAAYMQPLIDKGGEVAFLMVSTFIGVFGISGAGVAQAKMTHDLFLPLVQSMNIDMSIWALVVLVSCQVTFFVTPTVDMVGQMGLARSKDIKAMLKNGWVLTVITFAYVLIRSILYTMS